MASRSNRGVETLQNLTGRDMVLVRCDSAVVSSDKYEKGDQVMNKWNRLLKTLDYMFGFRDQKKSTFRKVSHTFDERQSLQKMKNMHPLDRIKMDVLFKPPCSYSYIVT